MCLKVIRGRGSSIIRINIRNILKEILNVSNLIIHTFRICVLGVFTAAFDTQIEWLIVKGIADYADCAHLTSEGWASCASVMAASLVTHILSDPVVFRSWPHYQGNFRRKVLSFLFYHGLLSFCSLYQNVDFVVLKGFLVVK